MSDGINSVHCFVETETEDSSGTPCPRPPREEWSSAVGSTQGLHKYTSSLRRDKSPRLPGVRPARTCTWADQGAKDKQEQSASSLWKSPFQIPVSSRRMSYLFRLAPRVPQTDSSKSINQGNSCSKPSCPALRMEPKPCLHPQ